MSIRIQFAKRCYLRCHRCSVSSVLGKKRSNIGIPISLVVGDDLDLAMLEDTHARVCRSEIDADGGLLGHCDGVFDVEECELEGAVDNLKERNANVDWAWGEKGGERASSHAGRRSVEADRSRKLDEIIVGRTFEKLSRRCR